MVNEAIKHFEEKTKDLQYKLDNFDNEKQFRSFLWGATQEEQQASDYKEKSSLQKGIEKYKEAIRSIENDQRWIRKTKLWWIKASVL